jgi:carbonic anhydrase
VPLRELLDGNDAWAAAIEAREPGFFDRLVAQQAPRWLWIGCSDSRVPANEVTGTDPGEMFVHRNVANVVVHTDFNCLAVLQYAIDVLRVEEIVVCGHLGCGGVKAALDGTSHGLIDNWLRHVQDVALDHAELLEATEPARRADVLCILNVVEQIVNLTRTTIVQDVWRSGRPLAVHGVVYALHDGRLRDLGMTVEAAADVAPRRAEVVAGLAAGA